MKKISIILLMVFLDVLLLFISQTRDASACVPKTCVQMGASCGTIGDGCRGTLDCGDCPGGKSCDVKLHQCTGGCVPKTCAQLGASCGMTSDGCGGLADCGDCPAGKSCDRQVLQCVGVCVPKTCAQLSASCGIVGDGCGGTVDCLDCPRGNFCDPQLHQCVNCDCDDGNPCTKDACDKNLGCEHEFDMCEQSLQNACPCERPADGWKNHAEYTSCVAELVNQMKSSGFISEAQADAMTSQATQSSCGKKIK